LAIGGRRTDSAISYTGAEPGIGLSMREWIADGGDRAELFIGSKVGPGGACWPLGYNESISQAKMILGYYNQLNSTAGRSPPAVASVGQLDTLLVHWPVNGQRGGAVSGQNTMPCSVPNGHSIPTTDKFCDFALATYDERECRVSTWRGMVTAWRMGLTRSIGVSNWNSTMMQDLVDAGLPLPALNQIQWEAGHLEPGTAFTPYPRTETFASEYAWCQKHGVLVNGYSPFGGSGQAGKTFSQPSIKALVAERNVSAARIIMRWNLQLGIASNPLATNPAYQKENIDIFGFVLTDAEMACMNTLNASLCPVPPAKCRLPRPACGQRHARALRATQPTWLSANSQTRRCPPAKWRAKQTHTVVSSTSHHRLATKHAGCSRRASRRL
jgi:diketogulonate reductase-like aldo/keto reductase